jgi:LmbE family N-acetylglucosaminyl deacetylase
MPESQSAPRTLCFVFAHPDDESCGVAGTVAKYAARGARTALICVTRGEAGLTGGLADSPEALSVLRSAELACAAQAMSLSELVVCDFPDGEGERWDREALAAQLSSEICRLGADVVVTFDCYGITRHPDHVVLGEVTGQVVTEGKAGHTVRRLYYQVVTCPEAANPDDRGIACVPVEEISVTVDVRDFEEAKRAALRCHISQAADTAILLGLPFGSLSAEQYQLAWSADGWQSTPGESDLLAGL